MKTQCEPFCRFNYDETNLTDDPGSKRAIVKRGEKYPERIMDTTKSAVSLMFCGNAEGTLLPPYVVYKSEHLWSTWCEGGPSGTRYNRSKSGWFDTTCFEDWFFTILVPALSKKAGKKILIGDNLSSHINAKVLTACREHNIAFVALPPNSTHLLQPLDVAFFAPMKRAWRGLIEDWKKSSPSTSANLSKADFPRLLKSLVDSILISARKSLQSGFRKTGLVPVNANEPLSRLPNQKHDGEALSTSFLDHMKQYRKQVVGGGKRKKRRVTVEPGKSMSNMTLNLDESSHVSHQLPSTTAIPDSTGAATMLPPPPPPPLPPFSITFASE